MIGLLPLLMISTLVGFTSTPITSLPASARHAADTQPTYPKPNTLNFTITFLPFRQSAVTVPLQSCVHRLPRTFLPQSPNQISLSPLRPLVFQAQTLNSHAGVT